MNKHKNFQMAMQICDESCGEKANSYLKGGVMGRFMKKHKVG